MRTIPIVFVIDDDAAVRDVIRDLLLSVGHMVESFGSAEEFLARRDPQAAGCLVLDVRLPGTSGLELQKRLVAQKDRIPIIFISGYGDVPMAVQVMKAGAVDFGATVLSGHQEVGGQRHGFPRDHEGVGVIRQQHESHAGEEEVVLQAQKPRRGSLATSKVAGGE